MAILGDAWVVLKAITTGLKKDVEKGLDEAGRAAEEKADKQGKAYGAHFGDEAESELKKGFRDKLGRVFDDADLEADKRGSGLGSKFAKGVMGALGSIGGIVSGIIGPFMMLSGVAGVIGVVVAALGDLVVGAIAVSAALGPALSAIGLVGAGALTGLLTTAAAGIGIFKQLSGEMSTLGPIAKDVRETWSDLSDKFNDVFYEVANAEGGPLDALHTLLHDLGAPYPTTDNNIFGVIKLGIQQAGIAITEVIKAFDELIKNPIFQANLGQIFKTGAEFASSFGQGIVSLIGAFAGLLATFSPLTVAFGSWFQTWAAHISDLVQAGQESGKLGDFMLRAGQSARQLFDILGNLWDILKTVFKSATPLGSEFLGNFAQGTQAVSDFLKTAEGGKKLQEFFDPNGTVRKNLATIWDLVKQLGSSLSGLVKNSDLTGLGDGLIKALGPVADTIQTAITAVGLLGKALGDNLTSTSGLKGVQSIRDAIGDLGVSIAELGPSIGPILAIIGDLASNLSEVLGPAFAALAPALEKARPFFDAIGDALGKVLLTAITSLLPLIVQLLDAVAELTTAFAGSFQSVVGAAGLVLQALFVIINPLVDLIAKFAPVVTTAAVAFGVLKASAAISGVMTAAAQSLAIASYGTGALAASAGVASTAMTGLKAAVAPLLLVVAGVALAFSAQRQHVDSLAEGLKKGGDAAIEAQKKLDNPSLGDKFLYNLTHWGNTEEVGAAQTRAANEALGEQWRQMDALQQATQKTDEWTATYTQRLRDYGATSEYTSVAAERLQYWTAQQTIENYNTARASGDYATAVDMVADALWRQVDATQASVAASGGAEQSAIGLARAAEHLQDVRANSPDDALAIRDAELTVQNALAGTIGKAEEAAKQYATTAQANGDLRSAGELFSESLHNQVAALDTLISQTSGPAQDSLIQLRDQLTGLDGYVARPDVEVLTEASDAKVKVFLDSLSGIDHSLTEAEIKVKTDAAVDSIGNVLEGLLTVDGQAPTPEIKAKADDAEASIQGILAQLNTLDGTSTTSEINTATAQAREDIQGVLTDLYTVDGENPTPEIQAKIDSATKSIDTVLQAMLNLNDVKSLPQVIVEASGALDTVNGVLDGLHQIDGSPSQAQIDINQGDSQGKIATILGGLMTIDQRTATADVEASVDKAREDLRGVMFQILGIDEAHATPEIKAQVDEAMKGMDAFILQLLTANGATVRPSVLLDTTAQVGQINTVMEGLTALSGTNAQPLININAEHASTQIKNILDGVAEITASTPAVEVQARVQDAHDKLSDVMFQILGVDKATAAPSVVAEVSKALGPIDDVINAMLTANGVTAMPTISVNDQASGTITNLGKNQLPGLAGIIATPTVGLNTAPFTGGYGNALGSLNVMSQITSIPGLDLNPSAFNTGIAGATSSLTALGHTTAVPGASLNPGAFNTGIAVSNASLTQFGNRTAVPGASLNPGSFNGFVAGVNSSLTTLSSRVASPTVTAVDAATATISRINVALANIRDKTVTVTTKSLLKTGAAASGGLISSDQWTTVGEEGREMVFLSQGSYVATYQKAQRILAAASVQAAGIAGSAGGHAPTLVAPAPSGGGITVPITVNPSAGMDELELARATGRTFAFEFRKLS